MINESVNIFVLNWNQKAMTIDCIKSLEKVTYNNLKIILIDNGSTDGSVDLINEHFSNIEIIEVGDNLGYAGGNNYGFINSTNQSKYSIFLNNDTVVSPNFIEPLIKALNDDSSIKQSAPKILFADKPNSLWFAGGYVNLFFSWIRHRGIRKIDKGQYDNNIIIDYATGCCFCMRSTDFELFNMFDESFNMYGEDVDLSLRIQKFGGKTIYIPESKIWHKVSASIGGQFSFIKWKRKNIGKIKLIINNLNPIILPFALILNFTMIIVEIPILIFMKFRKKL